MTPMGSSRRWKWVGAIGCLAFVVAVVLTGVDASTPTGVTGAAACLCPCLHAAGLLASASGCETAADESIGCPADGQAPCC